MWRRNPHALARIRKRRKQWKWACIQYLEIRLQNRQLRVKTKVEPRQTDETIEKRLEIRKNTSEMSWYEFTVEKG